jgi:hypothetical protein
MYRATSATNPGIRSQFVDYSLSWRQLQLPCLWGWTTARMKGWSQQHQEHKTTCAARTSGLLTDLTMTWQSTYRSSHWNSIADVTHSSCTASRIILNKKARVYSKLTIIHLTDHFHWSFMSFHFIASFYFICIQQCLRISGHQLDVPLLQAL